MLLAAVGLVLAVIIAGLAIARAVQLNLRLRTNEAELAASREEARSSLRRLGETLRSTHDMTSLLSVVLKTAATSLQARSGAVFLLSPTRTELIGRVAHKDRALLGRRLRVGDGLAGQVAQTGEPVLVTGADALPVRSESEPGESTMLAVPLENARQTIGVLALYGREIDEPFREADLEAITSLAHQAAVGIENVLLHQEAQRFALTDGVTAVWNRRYFEMRLKEEVERSSRFHRSTSLLVIDLDHFKDVNDRYGHQRGDEVLIELTRRVLRAVRLQVDTLARFGGEEFVLILPETPVDGAKVVCEKILQAVSGEAFGGEGDDPIWVTVSIGAACFPQHGMTWQALFRSADLAMYEAKRRGRNRVITADQLGEPTPDGDEDHGKGELASS